MNYNNQNVKFAIVNSTFFSCEDRIKETICLPLMAYISLNTSRILTYLCIFPVLEKNNNIKEV